MSFNMEMAPTVVHLAWKHLLAHGRVSPALVRFCLVGTTQTGQKVGFQLDADYPYRTPWGWPVLDMDSSVGTLAMGLTSIQKDEALENLSLVMEQVGMDDELVFDFTSDVLEAEQEPALLKWRIRNIEEVSDCVMKNELNFNQCVAVVAQDTAFSLSDDLSAHMIYAMDGTKDILWIGANAGNGCDPNTLTAAAERACSITGRSRDVMVVSGDIVDLSEGWALIRKPHPVAVLDMEKCD